MDDRMIPATMTKDQVVEISNQCFPSPFPRRNSYGQISKCGSVSERIRIS